MTTLATRQTETHLVGASVEIQDMETRFAVAVRQRELLENYIRERLKPGKHYYKVRDGSKNSLTKEGAELVCLPHGYQPMYFKEAGPDEPPADNSPFQLTVRCRLMRGEVFAGEGMGSASSWHTDRDNQRKARFRDPGLCHNATLKMAQKSAYIAATLNATAASEFFTQDMEDAEGEAAPQVAPKDNRYLCPIHNVEWFKRGRMQNYAHPVAGTKEWCNMKDAPIATETDLNDVAHLTPEESQDTRPDMSGQVHGSTSSPRAGDIPQDKDGPSGVAADHETYEILVASLGKPSSLKQLTTNAKTLGYTTPESIRAVIGPASDLVDLDAAQYKLIQASPLRPKEEA